MSPTREIVDLMVAGGGYVGLSLALAVKKAAPRLKVTLIDQALPPRGGTVDLRSSAIAAAACRMLGELGVWETISPHAEPIRSMVITDSQLSDAVRPVFLTFDETHSTDGPFAYMVPNAVMTDALRNAARACGVEVIAPASVVDALFEPSQTRVKLSTGEWRTTRLLAACDGAKSKLRALAGIRTLNWSYGQSGIVTTIEHEFPHEGIAYEHFLPAGPFATLPLTGNRSSLVWTERTDIADRLVKEDEFIFEEELKRRLGERFGWVKCIAPRVAYPLGLTVARDFVKPRFALVGDAAHGIHPIAGQGLNLGFKDVAALAEVLVDAARLGQDIGALDVLERYQTWRRFDTAQMAVTTDVLTRLFSNDIGPVRLLRDIGLGLVDRLPKLKQHFIHQAAGRAGHLPRLLNGLPI